VCVCVCVFAGWLQGDLGSKKGQRSSLEPFLPSCIPDLELDILPDHIHNSRSKLNPNGVVGVLLDCKHENKVHALTQKPYLSREMEDYTRLLLC